MYVKKDFNIKLFMVKIFVYIFIVKIFNSVSLYKHVLVN